jgi:hypothetical protein
VISSSQRPLPDNTQHSQETDIHAPVGFKPTILVSERPKTHALDRTATGIGHFFDYFVQFSRNGELFLRDINYNLSLPQNDNILSVGKDEVYVFDPPYFCLFFNLLQKFLFREGLYYYSDQIQFLFLWRNSPTQARPPHC